MNEDASGEKERRREARKKGEIKRENTVALDGNGCLEQGRSEKFSDVFAYMKTVGTNIRRVSPNTPLL
jgi:hypothetical protein